MEYPQILAKERRMRTHEVDVLRHDSSVPSLRHIVWFQKTSMFRTYAKASATHEMVVKILHINSVIGDSDLDRLDILAGWSFSSGAALQEAQHPR